MDFCAAAALPWKSVAAAADATRITERARAPAARGGRGSQTCPLDAGARSWFGSVCPDEFSCRGEGGVCLAVPASPGSARAPCSPACSFPKRSAPVQSLGQEGEMGRLSPPGDSSALLGSGGSPSVSVSLISSRLLKATR